MKNIKFGFTLAEVLITLGIIGVVAALTISVLVKKIQHKTLETKFEKAVSLIQNAVYLARDEMGVESVGKYCTYWTGSEYANAKECGAVISTKLRIVGNQKYDNTTKMYYTVVHNSRTFNNKADFGGDSSVGSIIRVNQLEDGSYIGFNVSNQSLFFGVDLNGNAKPNRAGYDVFVFVIGNGDKVVGYGTPNPSMTDEMAAENNGGKTSGYYYNFAGNPCNRESTRVSNGVGCAYYALRKECPWDSSKTYFGCIP